MRTLIAFNIVFRDYHVYYKTAKLSALIQRLTLTRTSVGFPRYLLKANNSPKIQYWRQKSVPGLHWVHPFALPFRH
jgi:hypothetical protein